MAVCELKFYSDALQKATAATIILPEARHSGPFAVFYLLHGLSDDQTIWCRRTSIERYVENVPLMVVMPDGGRGFYCDAVDGLAWESALIRDLISYIDSRFHTNAGRNGRCIGGLSMGGYGAVKLALKFPDLFCSASSHSGALAWAHKPYHPDLEPRRRREWERILGENPIGGSNDIFALAEKLPAAQRPALRIDCGVDDFLIQDNRAFHAHLTTLGYDHQYLEAPGEHNWAYWDLHVQEAISFHLSHLRNLPGAGDCGSRQL
ncbi:MAG TPA: alpha/beta hydrolase family protein [Chthonomonadales bacterium]|nr:alpha/beta hydrolase family protein [Chthonomonadales bacterium]